MASGLFESFKDNILRTMNSTPSIGYVTNEEIRAYIYQGPVFLLRPSFPGDEYLTVSGFETTGLVLSALPILLLGGIKGITTIASLLRNKWSSTRAVYRKDGLILALLLNLLPDASRTMERIDKVLSGTETDLSEFRESLSSNMTMVAIAGAIIAQVGITALALEAVDQAHWTAAAFFVASLIFGVLSVYVSFIVQQELNGLPGSTGVADWLSRPLTFHELLEKTYAISHHRAFSPSQPSFQGAPPQVPEVTQLERGGPDVQLKREVSALSAIMLATPAGLLSLSLNAFVFGLGIYLGCVYTRGLIPGFGASGSLGILIFYLVAATVGVFLYTFPRILKSLETHNMKKMEDYRVQLEGLGQVVQDNNQRVGATRGAGPSQVGKEGEEVGSPSPEPIIKPQKILTRSER